MKKNDEDNKLFISDTLAKSKTITKSANNFLQQNNLVSNNPKFPADSEEPKKRKQYSNKEEREAIKEELNEEGDENINTDDEDNDGIFTLEYVTKNIERYEKQVARFDAQVKKYLLLTKIIQKKKMNIKQKQLEHLRKKNFIVKL